MRLSDSQKPTGKTFFNAVTGKYSSKESQKKTFSFAENFSPKLKFMSKFSIFSHNTKNVLQKSSSVFLQTNY